ncbi:nuclear transport factor 2 family protein [Flectobacillus sp. DC10W]|uniref:Nuclear transport factor 2 family protein n=1 Tax=Flectobacillus longus TaxID=2984207 RepID=A0ABT6YH26_9BACT|nr:nuclear transport factor 2 family protein [Flectobacillus longus]MDI9862898.1 nuclear transport factor 2 family protein [Flectobacillus longus]
MKKILFISILCCCSTFSILAQKSTTDLQKINKLLEIYKMSINKADTTLGKKVFITTQKLTFIHPRGHEKGWDGIKRGIYEMFGTTFSNRNLKSDHETITVYKDMAILEFYWVFDATFADEKLTPLQTRGRETQVLKKINGEWKIVHVHYSNMPVIAEGQGF